MAQQYRLLNYNFGGNAIKFGYFPKHAVNSFQKYIIQIQKLIFDLSWTLLDQSSHISLPWTIFIGLFE